MFRKLLIATMMSLISLIPMSVSLAQSGNTDANTSQASAVQVAWQPFQGGVMMWFSDTDQIWVFVNSSATVYVYSDPFSEGNSNSTASSGDCSNVPVRGFGIIWQNQFNQGNTSDLGCPMADEIGFDTGGRVDSGSSFTIEILGPGQTRYGVNISSGAEQGTWSTIRYF
jgi:hypothetical protein